MMTPDEQFLSESNAIEGVYDKASLADAVKAWEYLSKQKVLTLPTVLMTHRILMKRQPLETQWRGHFRKCKVYVGGKEATAWERVPDLMQEWIAMMNVNVHPHDWKAMHVQYEHIHPFVDGNGRTGRMFMNWHRIKNGQPLYVVKAADRFKYYEWFRKARV